MAAYRLAIWFGLACWPVFSWGQLPNHTPIPGGVATVALGPAHAPKPTAHFGRHAVVVTQDSGRWVSIVGLGLDTVPGRYILKTTAQDQDTDAYEFTVRAHRYRVTRPEPIVRKGRAKRAAAVLSDITYHPDVRALRQQLPETQPELPLRVPIDAVKLTDRFGEREVDQQTSSPPIRFLEFVVASERPVLAPGTGRVIGVLTFPEGKVLAIDHGMGLLSLLWPVSEVTIRVNDDVARGAKLGTAALQPESNKGQLRWSVTMNTEFVNPRLLAVVDRRRDSHALTSDRVQVAVLAIPSYGSAHTF